MAGRIKHRDQFDRDVVALTMRQLGGSYALIGRTLFAGRRQNAYRVIKRIERDGLLVPLDVVTEARS